MSNHNKHQIIDAIVANGQVKNQTDGDDNNDVGRIAENNPDVRM